MISKLYTIISNKLWDLSLYFWDLYNRWSLQVSKKLHGLVNASDFEQCKRIEIIVLAICWRLSAFKSPSHKKSIFLKIRSFFSFKFFQGHNWLTNYPDSEFHDHWKTVTLSSISPNLSKHWRFLAFWLSLCFGSCLLFLVCHYTAFLFSTRAMTALGWLPNAHRDMIILVRWENRRDSRHVTSLASWVYIMPRIKNSKKKMHENWLIIVN